MAKIILSINAGSSSVKVSVYETPDGATSEPKELAVAQVDGLTAPPAQLKYTRGDKKIKGQEAKDIESQEDAFKYILDQLMQDEGLSELKEEKDIAVAAHRIVHGGDYPKFQVIDKDTYHHLEELSDLAPLHNASALTIVRAVHSSLPSTKNIAYFDTSFHSTIPPHISTYPIPKDKAKTNKLRKYGFHGISYAFILRSVAAYLRKDPKETNIIALHLGSGASACCIRNGQSYDTTMGLTPLAGLPGATRSGDVDASLVFHLTHDAGKPSPLSTKDMHLTTAEELLNKKCGWKALTDTTDFGEISKKALEGGDADAKLAFDLFVDRIIGYVGNYYVKLGGQVDALVFAGGIGEKGAELRSAVAKAVECLGFELDAERNKMVGDEDGVIVSISSKDARHKILVCRTDEQLEMARGVMQDAAQATE